MSWRKLDAKNSFDACLFRELSDLEEKEFRQWAKNHPKTAPDSIFHPVINDELRRI